MPDLPFSSKILPVLFAVHAILTFAAAVVLIITPPLIPDTVGINISPDAYLICYLLAASELSLAFLSWNSRKITDLGALRIVVVSFIVLHASSVILEIYAFLRGVNAAIWGNIVFRIFVIFLFAYYGLYKTSGGRIRQ